MRELVGSLQCGSGREERNMVLSDFDIHISEHMLLPPQDCFLHKHHCETSKPLICTFFVRGTVHLNSRTFTETFECLDNMKYYSLHPVRQIEFIEFMNISISFILKSQETMKFFWRVIRLSTLESFHALIYISTCLKV